MTKHSTPRLLLVILGLLALASAAQAQMDAGFIGKRYAGLGFFTENVRDSNMDNGNGVELFANVPILDFLDAGFRASSERFSNFNYTDRRIGGYVTAYADLEWAKPFVEFSIGETNQSSTYNNVKYRNRESLWATSFGLEIPVTRSSALFASAAYTEYFNSSYDSAWIYKFGLNTWFTPKLGAMIGASFYESESITYSLGLNFRF
ncbi:MAG: hypothetical protein QM715_16735 [Nibricoccus sp.]